MKELLRRVFAKFGLDEALAAMQFAHTDGEARAIANYVTHRLGLPNTVNQEAGERIANLNAAVTAFEASISGNQATVEALRQAIKDLRKKVAKSAGDVKTLEAIARRYGLPTAPGGDMVN